MTTSDNALTEHSWEDMSHHGSPSYFCRYCNVPKNSPKGKLPCPKAAECIARLADERERRDRDEWLELKRRKQREQELQAKYGQLP